METVFETKVDEHARLVECVRGGLAMVGQTSSQVIIYHLEREKGVALDDVPDEPGRFVVALSEMFGEGAKPIFLSILRELLVCSPKGVEFSPLAAALTEGLSMIHPGRKQYLGARKQVVRPHGPG
jgi:hypothetical protein